MANRSTRSRSRQQSEKRRDEDAAPISAPKLILKKSSTRTHVTSLPGALSRQNTGLESDQFDLLQLKQRKLRDPDGQVSSFVRSLSSDNNAIAQAAAATLVFAQYEAGTAVCISPDGLLLTCSHCIAESQEDFNRKSDKWLLFSSGQVVRARCVVWDSKRDLALLQTVAAQGRSVSDESQVPFPSAILGTSQGGQLLCIGHPGSEDLEASTSGIETDYDVLHISTGRSRGLADDKDPQDNSEIGAMLHDCWTYWGHSGAPLITRNSGKLVGLHSSWDDSTGMRRGVPLVAIRAFLDEHTIITID